jgi:hypothetical protein
VLQLLQDGIGAPARENVAGQEQQRQAVGMRDGRRRHHVRCARANRARAGHHAAPLAHFSKGDRRQAHCLLVMRAQGRQPLACLVQRFADSSDIAVPENGKNAGQQRNFAVIKFARLRCEVANERLGHRQPDRGHPRPLALFCCETGA